MTSNPLSQSQLLVQAAKLRHKTKQPSKSSNLFDYEMYGVTCRQDLQEVEKWSVVLEDKSYLQEFNPGISKWMNNELIT